METMRQVRAENAADLARYGLRSYQVARLQEIAGSLHRLDEASCNYGLTERQERNETRLEAEAAAIAKSVRGLRVYRQGDPRGWPLYIYRLRDLTAYSRRVGNGQTYDIDCCYNSVGCGVCPH